MSDTMYMQSRARSGSEMSAFISKYHKLCIDWKEYINSVLHTEQYSFNKISEKIGFSKNTIKKWCEEGTMPQNRDALIRLAFSLHMSIDETDTLLTRYGGYSALYVKDIYDAIILYILKMHGENPDNLAYGHDSLKLWVDKYQDMTKKRRQYDQHIPVKDTVHVYDELQNIREEQEFEQFIELNQLVFFSSHKKLISFIDEFITIRIQEMGHLYEEKYSLHKLMENKKNGSKFEKMLSQLKNYGILPERKYLIAFGIALNMTLFELNKMLSLAGMRTLYARDKFDWIIISGISQAMNVDSDLALNNAFKMEQITKNPVWRTEFKKIGDLYLNDEVGLLSEEAIDELSNYMIQNLKIFEDDSEEVKEIIQLLK